MVLAFATMVLAQLPGEHATGPPKSLYPLIEALVSENLTAFDELMAAGADPNVLDVVKAVSCLPGERADHRQNAGIDCCAV